MKVSINGKDYELDIPGDTPALWAIREEIGEESIKFGCGKGLCGACTILVDGKPRRSCVTKIKRIKNKDIITANGFKNDDKLSTKLKENWKELNVAQCGYCQPGQILKAYHLLSENSSPSEQEIKDSMDNLCRCGTYPRIIQAIQKTVKDNQIEEV